MALASHDPVANRGYLAMIASYLIAHQNANGSWDYAGRSHGDTSITQYAVLGLWEAENSGVDVSPVVWDRTASWLMSTQFGDGGWVYHHDEPSHYRRDRRDDRRRGRQPADLPAPARAATARIAGAPARC